jgi:hypothetical protein
VLDHGLAEQQAGAQRHKNITHERTELLDEINRQDERMEALVAAHGPSERALAEGRHGSCARAAPIARLV